MSNHSAIGPSALHRLLECPGSHRMSHGRERRSSIYAAEGSVAHQIVENELDEGVVIGGPQVGDTVTYEGFDIEVTQDMADHVAQMVAFCETLKTDADQFWVEEKLDMGSLWAPGKPPEPFFGTMDFGAYNKGTNTLYVVDFKYGRLPVSPHDNPQALAYSLGAVYRLGFTPETVINVIIQPRGQDNHPVKVATVPGVDLMLWADETLKPGLDKLFDPAAPLVVGDWCRFCPAKGDCPALYELAKKQARAEFTELPKSPVTLDDAELSEVLDWAEVLTLWIAEVRAEASGRIEKGTDVPGWKLVPKRALRKWAPAAEEQLLSDGAYYDLKPKSPAQIEKIDRKFYRELEEAGLVTKQSSGTTLAPDHDPRAAVRAKSAKDEFGRLE